MLFNSIDLSPYFRIKDIRGRGLSRRIVNGISVPGMDGEHFSSVETPGKYLEVEIRISSENLRETIDKLNGILATDDPVPIVFPDEPDKTYYGMAEASEEGRERVHLGTHDAMIVIRRSDPYKYGPEHSQLLTADTTLIENPGSVEAYPVFEMEVLEPVTFAMVSNGEEYNLIGKPVEEEGNEEIVDEKVSVLYENGSTVDEWEISSPDHVDEHANDIDGRMVGDSGVGIRADSYGTGNRMHGPAITRELPEAIQDFEISSVFDIISRREIENFRMEIYFHDENMNNLGKLGIKDNTRSFLRRRGLGRAGHYRGDGPSNGYAIGQHNHSYDNVPEATIMQLRVKREGNKFTFYIARWYTQRHVDVVTESFNDVNNEFSGRLKFITLFIGSYQDRVTPWRLRMNSVEVFELRTVTEDQTPYIAYPGDIITFDHITEEILLNGEDATPHKDFGGDYFQLQKGENQIAVLPDLSFNSELKYRPRYR